MWIIQIRTVWIEAAIFCSVNATFVFALCKFYFTGKANDENDSVEALNYEYLISGLKNWIVAFSVSCYSFIDH